MKRQSLARAAQLPGHPGRVRRSAAKRRLPLAQADAGRPGLLSRSRVDREKRRGEKLTATITLGVIQLYQDPCDGPDLIAVWSARVFPAIAIRRIPPTADPHAKG